MSRILPMQNCGAPRRRFFFFSPGLLRAATIYGPVIGFLIILVAGLKHSAYVSIVVPESDKNIDKSGIFQVFHRLRKESLISSINENVLPTSLPLLKEFELDKQDAKRIGSTRKVKNEQKFYQQVSRESINENILSIPLSHKDFKHDHSETKKLGSATNSKMETQTTQHSQKLIRYNRKTIQSTMFPLVDEFMLDRKVKRFDNEEARLVGFKIKANTNLTQVNSSSTKLIYLATPYFSEWNAKHYYSLHLGDTTFKRYACPVDKCHVTKDPSQVNKADAVLFHLRDLEVFSVPSLDDRPSHQIWILYSMEPPWLEVRDLRRFDSLFNWTMSYRKGSDIRIQYGFIGRRKNRIKGPRKVPGRKINKAIWLVSNCNTDSRREKYVERLRRVYPVDIRGGCGIIDGCRPAETRKCYVELAVRYKFYLAFENAICEEYVTEKLFNILEYPVVPVVMGGVNYSNGVAPPNSVIDAMEFASPEELGNYLWEVSKDDSLYLSYFEWKTEYRSYLQPWMCDLCEKLHSSSLTSSHKTSQDLEIWWYGDRPCMRWMEHGFKPVTKHAFPKYHSKLFE